jgi:predicted nucleic acid-binding protein
LSALKAPRLVRNWIANPPAWAEVRETPGGFDADPLLNGIHEGEQAAIALAAAFNADLLLMDDRKCVIAAQRQGPSCKWYTRHSRTCRASGLTDFTQAIERLRQTNFRSPEALLDALLKKHSGKV